MTLASCLQSEGKDGPGANSAKKLKPTTDEVIQQAVSHPDSCKDGHPTFKDSLTYRC